METKSILIVEDEKDILDLLTINLIRKGYQVKPVANCTSAIGALQKQAYDLIMSDNCLPDGLGIDLLASLQGNPALVDSKFVLMTAGMAISPWADEAIADGFLDKPFSINEMMTIVENLLAAPSFAAPGGSSISHPGSCQPL